MQHPGNPAHFAAVVECVQGKDELADPARELLQVHFLVVMQLTAQDLLRPDPALRTLVEGHGCSADDGPILCAGGDGELPTKVITAVVTGLLDTYHGRLKFALQRGHGRIGLRVVGVGFELQRLVLLQIPGRRSGTAAKYFCVSRAIASPFRKIRRGVYVLPMGALSCPLPPPGPG